MTQRNEPTVGILTSLLGGKPDKAATPEELVTGALQSFVDAQVKLEEAQAAIATQKAEHEAEIEARQKLLETATDSHSRLERIKGRFADLLA